LNLAKKYDKGIPNRHKSDAEMVAEIRLSTKALATCGRNIPFNTAIGSTKTRIFTSG
jgi:hypothetical protein